MSRNGVFQRDKIRRTSDALKRPLPPRPMSAPSFPSRSAGVAHLVGRSDEEPSVEARWVNACDESLQVCRPADSW